MNKLRQLRESRDLLQRDIAKVLNISTSAYGFYETGLRNMSAATAKKLAEYFNVTVDYLLGVDVPKDKKLVPVLGTVKAGYDSIAEQDIIGYIEPHGELSNPENYFALKIKGDSMSPILEEGSHVIVEKTQGVFESGNTCVVLIGENEATVKRVFKMQDGIQLEAFNQYYPPRRFTYKEMADEKVQIIGVVRRAIRDF